MTSMTASTPFTIHDLEGMPDDGRRYELIDGELLVSPASGLRHQTVALRLYRLLDDGCPTTCMSSRRRLQYKPTARMRCNRTSSLPGSTSSRTRTFPQHPSWPLRCCYPAAG
jgi:Putative restriction endonuclease